MGLGFRAACGSTSLRSQSRSPTTPCSPQERQRPAVPGRAPRRCARGSRRRRDSCVALADPQHLRALLAPPCLWAARVWRRQQPLPAYRTRARLCRGGCRRLEEPPPLLPEQCGRSTLRRRIPLSSSLLGSIRLGSGIRGSSLPGPCAFGSPTRPLSLVRSGASPRASLRLARARRRGRRARRGCPRLRRVRRVRALAVPGRRRRQLLILHGQLLRHLARLLLLLAEGRAFRPPA